jgi:hypothetical protein
MDLFVSKKETSQEVADLFISKNLTYEEIRRESAVSSICFD